MIYSKVKTLKFSLQLLTLFALSLTSVNLLHCGVNEKTLMKLLVKEARLIQSLPVKLSHVNGILGKIFELYNHDIENTNRTKDFMESFPSNLDLYDIENEIYDLDGALDTSRHIFYEAIVAASKKAASQKKVRAFEREIYKVLDKAHVRVKVIFKLFIKINRLKLIRANQIPGEDFDAPLGTLSKEKSFVKKTRNFVSDTIYDKKILSKQHIDLLDPDWLDNWLFPGGHLCLCKSRASYTKPLCREKEKEGDPYRNPEQINNVSFIHAMNTTRETSEKELNSVTKALSNYILEYEEGLGQPVCCKDIQDYVSVPIINLQGDLANGSYKKQILMSSEVLDTMIGKKTNQSSVRATTNSWFDKYCTNRLPFPHKTKAKLDKTDQDFLNLIRPGRLAKSNWWKFSFCRIGSFCNKRRRT